MHPPGQRACLPALQAEAMDYADPAGTSRIVQSLTLALDDAERFHPPEAALQTQHYLATIRCLAGSGRKQCHALPGLGLSAQRARSMTSLPCMLPTCIVLTPCSNHAGAFPM